MGDIVNVLSKFRAGTYTIQAHPDLIQSPYALLSEYSHDFSWIRTFVWTITGKGAPT